jgi:hypothetical protein
MAKVSAGIYSPDKYLALLEAFLTLGLAFFLIPQLGVAGIFFGNIISMLLVPNITQPYLVYNMIFKNGLLKEYYLKYGVYAILTTVYVCASYFICINLKFSDNFTRVICNILVCLVIPNLFNILFFHKTGEFKKLAGYAKFLLRGCRN